ncbi:spermidine synthase [Paenibacillus zeisoli]|uniref:Spermidine synthase n=1 Tax=Paenibacillus zeisoli TaxID=2496267 RepID=A0A3S1BAF9_9BACL|nr:fused MFS/spermidine synthase [Paenibacillus zeisoli]RUT35640.1 spermidine synthase [Paenibacillus zeisoli]
MQILFQEVQENQTITVYDTNELYGEIGSFRVLEFENEAIQGAMDLNDPTRIMFEYPRAIIHLMQCIDPAFEDVFVIGQGIGSIPRHFPDKRFKVAELNETVVQLSRTYFDYSLDNVVIGDGRQILSGEEQQAYDFIILDAFTEQGTPLHLISKEFFQITRDKLDAEGSLIMNLMGKGANDKLIHAVHSTLRQVYAYTLAFLLPFDNSSDLKNMILLGRNLPTKYQSRHMSGFKEIELSEGHIITD